MGAEDSDSGLPPSVFFTYRLEDREEHLSPQEVMAASELGRLYPFLGSNGVPQHINHASQASQNLLRKPVEQAEVLREKTENYRARATGKENLEPARRGGTELAGVHRSSRRKEAAAELGKTGKHCQDDNQQVRIRGGHFRQFQFFFIFDTLTDIANFTLAWNRHQDVLGGFSRHEGETASCGDLAHYQHSRSPHSI